jgi:hypothetical protein
MGIRIAASIVVIIAIGLLVAPVETSARGGGFAGGRAMPAGGMAAPMARPAVAPPRGLMAPTRPVAAPVRQHGRAPFAHVRHHRFSNAGLPVGWWTYPWYGDYYNPSAYSPFYQQPYYPDPATAYPVTAYPPVAYPPVVPQVTERIIYVVPPRPGCSTETIKLHSDKGGERSIDVVRC